MNLVTIKPGTGSHTENSKLYRIGDPAFEICDQALEDFRFKFDLVGKRPAKVDEGEGALAYADLQVPDEDSNTEAPDEPQVLGETVNVTDTSITDIMAAIEAGTLDAQYALDQETTYGIPRQSLVKKLVALLEGGDNGNTPD